MFVVNIFFVMSEGIILFDKANAQDHIFFFIKRRMFIIPWECFGTDWGRWPFDSDNGHRIVWQNQYPIPYLFARKREVVWYLMEVPTWKRPYQKYYRQKYNLYNRHTHSFLGLLLTSPPSLGLVRMSLQHPLLHEEHKTIQNRKVTF